VAPRRDGTLELFNPTTVNSTALSHPTKKTKRTHGPSKPLTVERASFVSYAEDFLLDKGLQEEIAAGRKAYLQSGYPLLRGQLAANTMDRIRVAMYETFGREFVGTITKPNLIESCLAVVEERFGVEADVAQEVADFGLVNKTVEGSVLAGELVLLEHNAVDSLAGSCVEAIGQMSGWVKREKTFVKVEVDLENIHWAELYLHKKVILPAKVKQVE
jgi:hypothetical protein